MNLRECYTIYNEMDLWECKAADPKGCPYLVNFGDARCCNHPIIQLLQHKNTGENAREK
jgi:hypothetical protein